MEQSDERLYFWLQQAAQRLRNAADRRCLAIAGVTVAQTGALFAVQDDPGCTQKDLAHALGQRESAITAMVKRLVTADLLRRETSITEHRARRLFLTERGQVTLHRLGPVLDRFNRELAQAIEPETARGLTRVLMRLAAHGRLD